MAIGARITSTNLSGKTATVTFVPYTGQTSGTTVDLGSKTIPFNNINSHPYGEYSLYFAEYDYTYTLTIPEPESIGVQMFVYSDRMVDSDNYGAVTLNFNDFTAEIIDLDVNINDWNNNSLYSLTESGYLYYFRGVNNSDDRLVVFTDSSNTEIGRYSGTTNNFSRNSLEGRWVTAEYGDLGVLKYSDGVSVYTYTWDPQSYNIDIEWDWDAVTSDGAFIIKKYLTGGTYNGDGVSYIVNPNDGTTTLLKTWSDATYIRHKMSTGTNFIAVETQNQSNETGNTYTNLEIYNLSGTVLETIPLTGATYNNCYTEFHGTNKFTTVYYNYDDIGVDYKIIHYNGNTETLIESSHTRGSYTNITMTADDGQWPSQNNLNPGGVVISFYNSIGYDNIGDITTYCDFVYMLNNQTSFTTYVFANDETKSFSPWGVQLSDLIRIPCDFGDGVFSLLTITDEGSRVESMNVFKTDLSGFNNNWLGNKSVIQIMTNNYTTVTYNYINSIGAISDSVSDSLVGQWATNMNSMGGVSYVTMRTASNGDLGYYVYGNNVDFNTTTYYDHTATPQSYDSETKELPDVMFLFSEGGINGRVLSSTGVTSQFAIPEFSSYNTQMGKDKFMIVYQDSNDNNYIKINLYDFSGTLLNSTSTTYTTWNNSWSSKDRFVVEFDDNGNKVFYLVSESGILPATIQSYDGNNEINDYIWND